MSLLSDDEIEACIHGALNRRDVVARTEAAILAKLAAKELPEPVSAQFQTLDTSDWHNFIDAEHQAHTEADGRWPMRHLFTAEQLHEAHAQGLAAGAASQLSAEPAGFIDKCGEIFAQAEQILSTDTPLYTRREAK